MRDFSFIHAADLHLDSPFSGITTESPVVADELRSATFNAYANLIELCIKKNVQFLVIAGDVYDGADRSVRAQLRFLDGLKKLSEHGIQAFIIHGNHDPLDGWSSSIEWPENVTIFGAEQVEIHPVEINGELIAKISGISYRHRQEHRNLAKKFEETETNLFHIGLLHCNCGGKLNHDNYAPCRLEDLTGKGIDYWALGHVHERQLVCSFPYVVYSGNTQGRNIREAGERGCYVVNVRDRSQIDLEFVQLNAISWFSKSIDIKNLSSIDTLDRAISQVFAELREAANGIPVICRIELTGRGALYKELRRNNTLTELLERGQRDGLADVPFVWLQKLEMNCLPEINLEKRRGIDDLLGQVLRQSEDYGRLDIRKENDQQKLFEILMPALHELYHNSRAEKVLDSLSPQELRKILKEAELLCADLLDSEL